MITYYANVELGGEITQISLEAKNASDMIKYIWEMYGISTEIIEIWSEVDNGNSGE